MICFQVEEIFDGSFVAEDVHLPHVYVDRVIKGENPDLINAGKSMSCNFREKVPEELYLILSLQGRRQ